MNDSMDCRIIFNEFKKIDLSKTTDDFSGIEKQVDVFNIRFHYVVICSIHNTYLFFKSRKLQKCKREF